MAQQGGEGDRRNGEADVGRGVMVLERKGRDQERERSDKRVEGVGSGVERERVEGVWGKHSMKREGVRRGSKEVDAWR